MAMDHDELINERLDGAISDGAWAEAVERHGPRLEEELAAATACRQAVAALPVPPLPPELRAAMRRDLLSAGTSHTAPQKAPRVLILSAALTGIAAVVMASLTVPLLFEPTPVAAPSQPERILSGPSAPPAPAASAQHAESSAANDATDSEADLWQQPVPAMSDAVAAAAAAADRRAMAQSDADGLRVAMMPDGSRLRLILPEDAAITAADAELQGTGANGTVLWTSPIDRAEIDDRLLLISRGLPPAEVVRLRLVSDGTVQGEVPLPATP